MSISTPSVAIPFENLCCIKCGIPIVMFKDMLDRRRSDGQSIFCPSGHSQVYNGGEIATLNATVARLQREIEAAIAGRQQAEADAVKPGIIRPWMSKSKIANGANRPSMGLHWVLNRLVARGLVQERNGHEWRATSSKEIPIVDAERSVVLFLRRCGAHHGLPWKRLAQKNRREIGESRERAALLRKELADLKETVERMKIAADLRDEAGPGTARPLPPSRGTPVF